MSDDSADKTWPATDKIIKLTPNLEAARKAVEDAAAVSAGLWLSYLSVLLYISVTAGSARIRIFCLERRSDCLF
jgi:hypothetical protein